MYIKLRQEGENAINLTERQQQIYLKRVLFLLRKGKRIELQGIDIDSNEFINTCATFFHQHYQDSLLSVKSLAAEVELSERQLLRKFKEILGISPNAFINEFRLQMAKSLLKKGVKVNEVALSIGFTSASYLARQYKKKYGVSPTFEKNSR